VTAGVAICKDMDFPAWTRRYAAAGARVLFVPAWDFGEDAWLHGRMAVLRGVEGGFAVARAAQEGLLTASDACGRIVAERRSDSEEEVMLECSVPAGPGDTLYSRWGDWFGWLNVAALAAGLLLLSRPRPAGSRSAKS
jgi:apolipoprotein N-acyltransferase